MMRNLAGNKDASDFCELELRRANIDIVNLAEMPHREVPSMVEGKFGKFTFVRAWYYWVVSGPMPLFAAKEIYNNPIGAKDVRVDGNCTCPAPQDDIIDSYHIDSQEGLNLFTATIRKYGLA